MIGSVFKKHLGSWGKFSNWKSNETWELVQLGVVEKSKKSQVSLLFRLESFPNRNDHKGTQKNQDIGDLASVEGVIDPQEVTGDDNRQS